MSAPRNPTHILDAIQLLAETGFSRTTSRSHSTNGTCAAGTIRAFQAVARVPALITRRAEDDRNDSYTMADAVFSASFLNACLRQARVSSRWPAWRPWLTRVGRSSSTRRASRERTTFHVLACTQN